MKYYYPENLPITAKLDEIACTLLAHQVIIIEGDTGSGKTTQIPKICLDTLDIGGKLIGCTQPRRIAATSISDRVSYELGQDGKHVGYKIRFHDHTNDDTVIKFMTDGVLLAETRQDRLLRRYGVIIIDEAHERSLNIDFLLGYLKTILPQRPDLKLIITSATIDTSAFSSHFGNAPIISVSGRTHPVSIVYSPLDADLQEERSSYVEHCADTIIDICRNRPPGDILAFLPTEKDIRECCELLTGHTGSVAILPLFGRLSSADQRKIFQDHPHGKVVVATNVAETSLTVPGISYVVDTGLARMSYYSGRSKTTSLPVKRISQASCDQRMGRCGRIGPGICYRLYDDEDYSSRERFTLPEIKRSNLAEVILQMIALELGSVEEFPFVDPPQKSAIRDGYRLLFELGAIDRGNTLRPVGRMMATLPIDPCISRILIEAKEENCLVETKIIAAALAIQDPRIRPADKEKEADSIHREFAHPHSDFMVYLNLWNHYHQETIASRSWSKLKKYCKKNYLSFQRMREWFDLHEQLSRILHRSGDFTDNTTEASYQQIHRALTSGFLRNTACKKQGKIYQTGSNRELMIFPGSHQFSTGGQWIVAGSFLETNRLYALTVATIEPEWLESIASHLVKYSWSNPRWNKKSGQVVADEKVTLFGLVIVVSRTVNFPKRDKKNTDTAKDIFIQHALIEGHISGNYTFITHNSTLISKWQKEEDKLRTGSIVHNEAVFHDFYRRRLPAHVYDRSSLNRYLKRNGYKKLLMSEEDVLNRRPDEKQLADFPNTLNTGSLELQVQYVFDPGKENDGMNIQIPSLSAETLPDQYFEWLVPGLLHEKITYLLKGLPKRLRRHLVPVNVAVDRIMDDLVIYRGSLYNSLESSIHKLFSIQINRSDWPTDLPTHLTARFIVVDNSGRTVDAGRNLKHLISQLGTIGNKGGKRAVSTEIALPDHAKMWDGFTTRTWDFRGLPSEIPIHGPGKEMLGFFYPYLRAQTEKGQVTVLFSTDRILAHRENPGGVEYLYRLQFSGEYKSLRKYVGSLLTGPSVKVLLAAGMKTDTIREQFLSSILRSLFPSIGPTIPDNIIFNEETARVRKSGFYRLGQQIADEAITVIRDKNEVYQGLLHFCKLDTRKLLFSDEKVSFFKELLDEIVPADFFAKHSVQHTAQARRQLKSLKLRMERFYSNPSKDKDKELQLQPFLSLCKEFGKKQDQLSDEALELFHHYCMLVNEYRISLFSPEIKTTLPVSAKKLKKAQQELLSKCR